MSLPSYPEYKSSGVDWLGTVPVHWHVDRIKASIQSSRNGIWGDEPQGDERDIACVRVADFDRTALLVKEQIPTLRSVTEKERDGRILRRGNLLLEKSGGGELQPVGQVVMYQLDAPAVCSNFVAKVALKAGMVPSFWKYAHSAAYAVGVNVGSINQTSGIQNLDQDRYFNERAPYPPESEQTAIATFLDRETGKIDDLIAEQEKLLALLAEKRQATISHAVTKGLNPDAPMKESGVAWLGAVPKHWGFGALSRISERVVVGIAEAATHAYVDEGTPILRSTNVRPGRLVGEILNIDPAFAIERGSKLIRAGDLITVRTGNAGVTAVVPQALDECQCFTMLITTLLPKHSPDFFCFWMNSEAACRYFGLEGWGTAQVNISVPILKMLPVPIPPHEEQEVIVSFLDTETTKLDTLKDESERAIVLLKERRSALIAAAVTGQIDVRGLVPQPEAA